MQTTQQHKTCKLVFNNARQQSNGKQCNAILIVTHLQLCKGLVNTKIWPLPNPVGNTAGTSFHLTTVLENASCSLFKLISICKFFPPKTLPLYYFLTSNAFASICAKNQKIHEWNKLLHSLNYFVIKILEKMKQIFNCDHKHVTLELTQMAVGWSDV